MNMCIFGYLLFLQCHIDRTGTLIKEYALLCIIMLAKCRALLLLLKTLFLYDVSVFLGFLNLFLLFTVPLCRLV